MQHCNCPNSGGCACVQLHKNRSQTALQPMTLENGMSSAQKWRGCPIQEKCNWPQVLPFLHQRANWSENYYSFQRSPRLFLDLRGVLSCISWEASAAFGSLVERFRSVPEISNYSVCQTTDPDTSLPLVGAARSVVCHWSSTVVLL